MIKSTASLLLLAAALPISVQVNAKKPEAAPLHNLRIVQRRCVRDAIVTVGGKVKRIARDVYQVPLGEARLRYIDGESGKRRELGIVPFTSVHLLNSYPEIRANSWELNYAPSSTDEDAAWGRQSGAPA